MRFLVSLIFVFALSAVAIADEEFSTGEQRALTDLLHAKDWPFRAMGLLRCERFNAGDVQPLILRAVTDDAWQVRCFALRAAARLGIDLPPDTLLEETNPRVMRAACRAFPDTGGTVDPKAMERTVRRLLNQKALDEQLLGCEIAATTTDEKLRLAAERKLQRVLRRINPLMLAVSSRRLAALLGIDPVPDGVNEWRAWMDRFDDTVTLGRPESFRRRLQKEDAAVEAIGTLDLPTLIRLRDYLDMLKQRDLEIAVVMDATASMIPMVNAARVGVDSLILFLTDISKSMRLAFVAYRDHDNRPVWDGVPLTDDIKRVRAFLFDLSITGGADLPEAVYDGLAACTNLKWNESATKQIILVGDARPHTGDQYRIAELLDTFTYHKVTVHTVHVPMEITPRLRAALPPARLQEYEEHIPKTAEAFAEIADGGGGEAVTMEDADQLVPGIMHLSLDEQWWPAFDAFYQVYLEMCR